MFIEPVFGKKFFGREEVLATLQKRVNAIKGGYRQNLALTGPMLAGKSSILRHFLKSIKDADVIPVYVEMSGTDFDVFCMRFMATLLYQYLRTAGERCESNFDALKGLCRNRVPKTVCQIEDICKALEQKKCDDAYEMLLDLTSTFKSESGANCIVVLDEFHNLSNFRLKKPFQTFGKFIMVQENTMYIVSSSQKTLLKEILVKKLSLLFGNFEVIEINGFDNHTARSFIADKIKDTAVSENIKNYIIQISQGNPFYLEAILKRFSAAMKAKKGAGEAKECLLDTLAELLYDSGGIFNQYFTNNMSFFLEKKTRKKFIPILISLAKGNSKIKSIRNDLGKAGSDLGTKLQQLRDMDLIYQSGVFYKIEDKLFEFWLKNVYGLKMNAVVDDLDIKYLEFKNLIDKDFREYCQFGSKSLADVVRELFASFRNEKARVSMHERKLPFFESVEAKELPGNTVRITGRVPKYPVWGRAGSSAWLCHIKQENLTDEQDISALGNLKVSDEGLKISRKIIIPFKGIEHNAFLLAKEHNIWVWDIGQLNNCLRLFGKFELVL